MLLGLPGASSSLRGAALWLEKSTTWSLSRRCTAPDQASSMAVYTAEMRGRDLASWPPPTTSSTCARETVKPVAAVAKTQLALRTS